MTAQTEDLIERLEAAEAGSRELDAHVWAGVNGYELFEHDGAGWRYRMSSGDIMRHERTSYISPLTTSLDAALALAERVLPGWLRDTSEHETGRWYGCVTNPKRNRRLLSGVSYAYAPTPALALCIAILRARALNTGSGEG